MQYEKLNVLFKCDKNVSPKEGCCEAVYVQEHNFMYCNTLLNVGYKGKEAFTILPACELKEGEKELSLGQTGMKTRNRRVQ